MSFNVKITTFPSLFDLLAPHSCRGCGHLGEVLCDCCKNYIIKSRPRELCPNCKHTWQGFCLARGVSGGHDRGTRRAPPVTLAPWDANCRRQTSRSDAVSESQQKPAFLHYAPLQPIAGECPYCHFPLTYIVGLRGGTLSSLIHDYKYHSTRAIGAKLAELLDAALPQNLPKNTVIVPLPTASHHVRERGLDHTYLIAKKLAVRRDFTVEKLLLRNKNTTQVGSSRKDRLKQAVDAYTLNPNLKIDPTKTYLLLDDVWTTGASMRAALEKLRAAGAKHYRIALLALSEDDK